MIGLALCTTLVAWGQQAHARASQAHCKVGVYFEPVHQYAHAYV
jgi:hypothetical protein